MVAPAFVSLNKIYGNFRQTISRFKISEISSIKKYINLRNTDIRKYRIVILVCQGFFGRGGLNFSDSVKIRLELKSKTQFC